MKPGELQGRQTGKEAEAAAVDDGGEAGQKWCCSGWMDPWLTEKETGKGQGEEEAQWPLNRGQSSGGMDPFINRYLTFVVCFSLTVGTKISELAATCLHA